jgi:hypothetical protein
MRCLAGEDYAFHAPPNEAAALIPLKTPAPPTGECFATKNHAFWRASAKTPWLSRRKRPPGKRPPRQLANVSPPKTTLFGGARANALGALAESAMGAFSQIKK